VPHFSFIAPINHRPARPGNAGPQCDFDPNDTGTLVGLNPALMYIGDHTLRNIVKAFMDPRWNDGRNAIVVLWMRMTIASLRKTIGLLVCGYKLWRSRREERSSTRTFRCSSRFESAFHLPC